MADYAKKGKTFSHKGPMGQARKKAAEEMIKAAGEEHDAQFNAERAVALVGPIAGTVIGGIVGGPAGAAVGGKIGGVVGDIAAGDDKEAKKLAKLGKTANSLYGMGTDGVSTDLSSAPSKMSPEESHENELFSLFNMIGN